MRVLSLLSLTSLIFGGAIFGFFYAWVCSTMWGLDAADPRLAIGAMQAMNASVRNMVFAPAFFGTPAVMLLTGLVALRAGEKHAGFWISGAAIIYLVFGLLLTMRFNVPMNRDLAQLVVPEDIETARAIWLDYSPRWQAFNIARTIASGLSLLMVGMGILTLSRR